MKKSIKLLALVLALVMVLCGCSKKTDTDGEDGESTETETTEKFNYSNGLNRDGYWDGITATDYVTLPELTTVEIDSADIDSEVEYLLSTYTKEVQNTTRAIVDGDTVNIDYTGYVDGVAFDNGSTEGNGTDVTIGTTNYIDDFLEQLIGHKAGDTFDINVTFPDPYESNEDLSGKDAVFETTVNYIIEDQQYELGDEFVETELSDDYGWTTVEEMRAGICGALAFNELYDAAEFADEMPEVITQQIVDSTVQNVKEYASYYGLDADTYISYMYYYYGITDLESFTEYVESVAESQAQEYIFYQAVAETKNIKVSYKELNNYYEANDLDADDVLDTYGKGYVTSRVLYEKVMDYIYSLAVEK